MPRTTEDQAPQMSFDTRLDKIGEEISVLSREIALQEKSISPTNRDEQSMVQKRQRLAELESAFNAAH